MATEHHLNGDGAQHCGHAVRLKGGIDGGSSRPSNRVPISEQPLFSPRKLRVVCIGAGAAGLIVAYKIKHELKMDSFIDLVIYEKNSGIGGTWLENNYPGVKCDVPAPIYTFSWEPNPDWTSFYAGAAEILAYFQRTTRKYGLDEKLQLNSKVTSTVWDDKQGKWLVTVSRLSSRTGEEVGETFTDLADVLIDGSGFLNKYRWPSIPGLHYFSGALLHTARWDISLDLSGKRVALIGNGSSAIQTLPQIQPVAAKVVNYIRGPTWIAPNMLFDIAPPAEGGYLFSEEQKRVWREDEGKLVEYVNMVYKRFNAFFAGNVVGTEENGMVTRMARELMEERLGHDAELCAKLIPTWHVGCRRLTPGDGYLEALRQKNVEFRMGKIERITEKGIVFVGVGGKEEGEEEQEFDVIICATGFDVGFVPPWEIVGKGGVTLRDVWGENPEGYMGICAPHMPNYFVVMGPNSPVGHGSLLAVMEWAVEWMLRWCEKIAEEDIKSVTVRDNVVRDFNVYTQEFLKRTVWAGDCRSWYKNRKVDGPVTAMYTGSIFHFRDMLRSFRTEDFEFEYRSANRFRFMGNGFTLAEERKEDLSLYRSRGS